MLFMAIAILLSLTLSSCAKEELVNSPKVILTTDWAKRTEGIAIPSPYIVGINNKNLTYHSATNTLPELTEGTYPITIYNTADKVTINGSTATVATAGNTVAPQPGWLFYSTAIAVYENDKENSITATMTQQIRLLNIELTVTEGDINNIESVAASLSGVANTIDLKNGACSGTGLSVEPVFTKSGTKLIASVRLIGLTSETQNLTLDINYTSGSPQQVTSDVSSTLAGFGTDKHIPLVLKGNISISKLDITLNTEISGWGAWQQMPSAEVEED